MTRVRDDSITKSNKQAICTVAAVRNITLAVSSFFLVNQVS